MCLSVDTWKHYLYCRDNGHKLPVGACNKYAHGLKMCLDDLNEPKKFDFKTMVNGGIVWDHCSFCKAGKDIDGDFKYGENWEGALKYRRKGR